MVNSLNRLTVSLTSLANFVQDMVFGLAGDFNAVVNQWTVVGQVDSTQSRVQTCNSALIFGGPGFLNPGGYFERTYESTSTHSMIYFLFRFYIIDDWQSNDLFQVRIDDKVPMTFQPMTSKDFYGSELCGVSQYVDTGVYWIQGKVLHSASTVTIRITSNIQQAPDIASFGFRGLRLHFTTQTSSDTEGYCVAMGSGSFNAIYGTNTCTCPAGYYSTGTGCSACNAACQTCFGSSSSQCYSCSSQYSWDGTACVSCPTNCYWCSGSTCMICAPNYYLRWDNTCQTTCATPYIALSTSTNYMVCQTPCQASGYYMYWDNTCQETCPAPLTSTTQVNAKFCSFPCAVSTDYLYWDGTCSSTCTYWPRVWSFRNFCDPCASGLYLYPDGTCKATCTYPYTTGTSGSSVVCNQICPTGKYLLGTSTCVNTCADPMVPTTVNGLAVCTFPCSTNEYLYWNGSCLATCSLTSTTVAGYKFCDACSNSYYLYPDGSCKASCDSPLVSFTNTGFKECYYPCGSSNSAYNAENYEDCPSLYQYPLVLTSSGTCELDMSSESYSRAVALGDVLNKFCGFMSGMAILTLLFNPTDARPVYFLTGIKMLEYLKYIQGKFPPVLQEMMYTQKLGLGLLNLAPLLPPELWYKFTKYSIPQQFDEGGLHSSFFVNSWSALLSLAIAGGIIIIILISEIYIKDVKFLQWVVSKIKPALTLSTLMVVILLSTYFVDLPIYTTLELRTLHLHNFHAIFSFIMMLFTNGIVLFLFGRAILAFKEARRGTVRNAAGVPGLARNIRQIHGYKMLFDACRTDLPLRHMFLFVSLFRAYLFSLVLSLNFAHPFVQIFVAILLNIGMLVFLITLSPIKEGSNQGQFIGCEAIQFLGNLCALLIAIMDTTCSEAYGFREFLGVVIIVANYLLALFCAGHLTRTVIRGLFGDNIFDVLKKKMTFNSRNGVQPIDHRGLPSTAFTPKFITAQIGENRSQMNTEDGFYPEKSMRGEVTERIPIANRSLMSERGGENSSSRIILGHEDSSRLVSRGEGGYLNTEDSVVNLNRSTIRPNFDTRDLETVYENSEFESRGDLGRSGGMNYSRNNRSRSQGKNSRDQTLRGTWRSKLGDLDLDYK